MAKGLAVLIASKLPKPGMRSEKKASPFMSEERDEPEEGAEDEGGDELGLQTAAKDVLSAVRKGDAEALASALKDFIDISSS
jgi:hypothetical protein